MPKWREYQICLSGGSIGRRFGVDSVSASDLSRRIGVSETAEYWENSTYFHEASRRFSTGKKWDWHAPDAS
jgi:hypothetical protein